MCTVFAVGILELPKNDWVELSGCVLLRVCVSSESERCL